ncbi:hypothetical protein BHF68_13280 [Desulfuribacillus alkaliarsenatis]|uniref:Uncharacterized protein n=1 Tax=Desulfuribacillus alkaliarsenatis TaxID=766136 RepID=A0A1E5G406_9FIRM|nr:hypothetical protein BHF68_13280 [Desulfuribacillus alkaliarsenatis]
MISFFAKEPPPYLMRKNFPSLFDDSRYFVRIFESYAGKGRIYDSTLICSRKPTALSIATA